MVRQADDSDVKQNVMHADARVHKTSEDRFILPFAPSRPVCWPTSLYREICCAPSL